MARTSFRRWITCCVTALNRALSISASRSAAVWWLGVALIASAALVAPPMPEPVLFRTYVDQREIAGIPFFWNVVSNAPLLLVGIWGVRIVVLAFVHSRYTRGSDLFTVGALYGFAKAAEVLDRQIYSLGGILSGHALKHLLAAAALYWLARMLQCRAASPPS